MGILTINVKSEPVTKPPRLIYIKDRVQPGFCEACGSEGKVLFWSGRKMSCIECAKDLRAAIRNGMIVSHGISYKQFTEEFEARLKVLAQRLQSISKSGLKTGEDRYLFLKLIKEDGDPIEIAFTSRTEKNLEMARKALAGTPYATANRRDIDRMRHSMVRNVGNGSHQAANVGGK